MVELAAVAGLHQLFDRECGMTQIGVGFDQDRTVAVIFDVSDPICRVATELCHQKQVASRSLSMTSTLL